MGDGHRRCLTPEAPCKTPKRVAEEGWGCTGGPGTRHEHPTEIAIPLARTARAPLAATFIISQTYASPGGEPGRRPEVAHLRADLGPDGPGRSRLDAGETGELVQLWCQGRHGLADRLIQVGPLPVEQSDELQGPLDEPAMLRGTLPGHRQLELRLFPPQAPEGQRRPTCNEARVGPPASQCRQSSRAPRSAGPDGDGPSSSTTSAPSPRPTRRRHQHGSPVADACVGICQSMAKYPRAVGAIVKAILPSPRQPF